MSIRKIFLSCSVLAVAVTAHAQDAPREAGFADLTGTEIVDAGGNAAGVLRDVLVAEDGRIARILVGQGGVLGVGETLRVLNADGMPPLVDGKFRIDGQTADQIAALPEYRPAAATEGDQASGPPPVSGANQTAPQSAAVNIPVAPSAVPMKPDAALPPTPENDTATGQASADSSRAPGVSPTLGEETAQGSASQGMAPQQGTGTGSTQATPSANEGGGGDDGNAAGANPQLTQQYGRDRQPANQPMPEGSSGRAATDVRSPDLASNINPPADPSTPDAASAEQSRFWRLGEIVGASIRGDRDGLEVKDARLSGGRVQDVVISERGQPDRTVPFASLNIGGTTEKPQVALSSEPGAPAAPQPVAP